MKTLLLHNWSFMRIIRVIGGSYLLIAGYIDQEYVFVGVGFLILIQGIMNIGCGGNCSSNSCETKTDGNGKI